MHIIRVYMKDINVIISFYGIVVMTLHIMDIQKFVKYIRLVRSFNPVLILTDDYRLSKCAISLGIYKDGRRVLADFTPLYHQDQDIMVSMLALVSSQGVRSQSMCKL